jgi:parallel beta-helix repeat protein
VGYDPQRPFTSGWHVLPSVQVHNFGFSFSVLPADFTSDVKPGAIVQILDSLRYSDQFTTIVSVDEATDSITVADQFNAGTSDSGVTGSWRVLNDSDDLGARGEFGYNAGQGRAYIDPANPDTLSTDIVVAAQLSTLISLNSVSDVTITGLILTDTKSDKYMYSGAFTDKLAAIMGAGVSNSTISGNTFRNVGNGVSLSGSSGNSITENSFDQVGGSGINNVSNNSMNGLGEINAGSTGIHLENSAFNLVDSNVIDGSGRWGIDLYPSDGVSLVGNTISNNVIRNTSQQTNDTGAIYSYAGTSPGYVNEETTITGNRIENLGGLLRDGSGSYVKGATEAIYMDDQVSGVTMTNNVVEGDGSGMFLCHGCQSNTASNNVIVLQPAAYYDRGANGVTYSTGDMSYNGGTRVDLLPSYFPAGVGTSTIIVQLSGEAAGKTSAAFCVLADNVVIGTGTASNVVSEFTFSAQLAPHQIHRIEIALTNGVSAGISTMALHNIGLFVNNTPVQLVDPEATGGYGALGFVVGDDNLLVTNFSATQNIVYRSSGFGQDVLDWTDWSIPSYVDQDPGTIDFNLLYQDIVKITDTVFGTQKTDTHSLVADPVFTSAQTGDYTLAPNSPAVALGFDSRGVPLAP